MNRNPAKPFDLTDRSPRPLLKRYAELLEKLHPNLSPAARQGSVEAWRDAMPAKLDFLKVTIANFAAELKAKENPASAGPAC